MLVDGFEGSISETCDSSSFHVTDQLFRLTLEYRINGGGENNRGGLKWFDITIIGGGWNNRGDAWQNRK